MARKKCKSARKLLKKWGKIGAPGSAKRRAWMRRMRAGHKGRVLTRTVGGNHVAKKRRKKKRKAKRKAKRKVKRTRRRFP